MKNIISKKYAILKITLLSLFLIGCATNEITGRQQLILFPASQDVVMGTNALIEIRKTTPII